MIAQSLDVNNVVTETTGYPASGATYQQVNQPLSTNIATKVQRVVARTDLKDDNGVPIYCVLLKDSTCVYIAQDQLRLVAPGLPIPS